MAERGPTIALSRGVPPELLAIGSMLSVQLGAALAVPVMSAIGPVPTTALRLLWAGILLAFFARPRISRMTRYQWFCGVSLGIVIAVLTLCYFVAITRIPMGPATAIEFLGPLGVALIGARRLLHLVLAMVAGIGVFLLTRENSHWSVDTLGVGFAVAAALGWAAYILLMKKGRSFFPGTARPVDRTPGCCHCCHPGQLCERGRCLRNYAACLYDWLGRAHSSTPVCP